MITTGSQTSQITSNSNKNSLTRLKELLENFSLKLLCDVIFLFFPGQLFIFSMFLIIHIYNDNKIVSVTNSNWDKKKKKKKKFRNSSIEIKVEIVTNLLRLKTELNENWCKIKQTNTKQCTRCMYQIALVKKPKNEREMTE